MRRILLLMVAVLCITVASAQEKGETAVGAQVVYGSGDGLSNIGIGAKFQWNVINRLRLEPSFTYFLKKDNINMWNAGAKRTLPIPGCRCHHIVSCGRSRYLGNQSKRS